MKKKIIYLFFILASIISYSDSNIVDYVGIRNQMQSDEKRFNNALLKNEKSDGNMVDLYSADQLLNLLAKFSNISYTNELVLVFPDVDVLEKNIDKVKNTSDYVIVLLLNKDLEDKALEKRTYKYFEEKGIKLPRNVFVGEVNLTNYEIATLEKSYIAETIFSGDTLKKILDTYKKVSKTKAFMILEK